MSKSPYNPEIHHRRSIRLKGHDYAGGGLYFITICAHREFIATMHGNPFFGATCISPIQEIIKAEWKKTAELRPYVRLGEMVVMPDHFHALIALKGGHAPLGDVVGAFKAAVSREIHRRGDMHVARTVRIWHRNYYEMIVRSADAEKKIADYIRMNPWRCVQQFGNGLRGMGNPALWNLDKLGVLCSRNAPRPRSIKNAGVYLGGFHSSMEKEIFAKLLELKKPVIWCPAWGLEKAALMPGVSEALEANRMLILEMKNREGNLVAAEQRNRFVIESADELWLPHITRGGMLDRLLAERKPA
ncbi:transposase [Pontiella desulfatans]|nr:transposase [Pontiella desulfatans]